MFVGRTNLYLVTRKLLLILLPIRQLACSVVESPSTYSALNPYSGCIVKPNQNCALTRHSIVSCFSTTTKSCQQPNMTAAGEAKPVFKYPQVEREDTNETIFGVRVEDPYRYLEDPSAPRTVKFVEQQNAVTQPFLQKCPHQGKIKEILTASQNYQKMGSPFKRGDKYYFYMNTGLQPQYVLYQQDSLDGEPRVFLDPNLLSEDGTVSISSYTPLEFSNDFKYMAYCLSDSGSDWVDVHVKEVATGKDLPDVIKRVKFSGLTWTKDNLGFFYSTFPVQENKGTGTNPDQLEFHSAYYHKLGTQQSEDVLKVDFPTRPLVKIYCEISEDGKYLNVFLREGCKDNEWYYCELSDFKPEEKLTLRPIFDKMEASFSYISNDGKTFYALTNLNATNYRISKFELDNPAPENWVDIVACHEKDVITGAEMYTVEGKDYLLVTHLRNVVEYLELLDMEGKVVKKFDLPLGSIGKHHGYRNHSEIFFTVTSFLTAGQIYRYDMTKLDQKPVMLRQNKPDNFNPEEFTTKQVFYKSKDNTEIPMFLIHRKDLKMDGTNPCILYGYGGFGNALSPSFNLNNLVWLDNFKGIRAVANIRGGGEFGQEWHDAARLHKRQNAFDDFIAAAEYLISNNYTSRDRLAIQGGSNGGLLVATVSNQRPDLFGANICHVGVLDMIRFSSFTAGSAWTSDYGDPKEEKDFKYLIKYSPYHNIPKDVDRYPATLLLTGDHDDRVVPSHSLKFIAQLQHTLGEKLSETPLLIRIQTKAGHGGGKSVSQTIDEYTDIYSFLCNVLHLENHFNDDSKKL